TLNPKWDESFWHLVQSPHTQELRCTVLDWDLLSARDLIGQCRIRLQRVAEMEDEKGDPGVLQQWYHLGLGDFGDSGGCGKGQGRVMLGLTYRSLHLMPRNELAGTPDSCRGIIMVRVLRCVGLTGLSARVLRAQVQVKCNGITFVTPIVNAANKADHVFNYKNLFEFYDIFGLTGDVKCTVMELVGQKEDVVGFVEQPIAEFKYAAYTSGKAYDPDYLTGRLNAGQMLCDSELEEGEQGAKIHFAVHYVPCL
ncbi:hypothetical protein FOA52_014959, partial [Chlamydomonas sp. UWO 241]